MNDLTTLCICTLVGPKITLVIARFRGSLQLNPKFQVLYHPSTFQMEQVGSTCLVTGKFNINLPSLALTSGCM